MTKRSLSLISIIILISMLLCGCGKADILLPYYNNSSSIGDVESVFTSENSYHSKPISSDICVIPVDSQNPKANDKISAQGALSINIDTEKMIYSKNIYERLYPASLTKLATALVCIKYGNMDDTVTVSYNAAHLNTPGAQLCYIREGDKINFKTLLTAFLVHSGNDAGIALAEHVSGDVPSFVLLMNQEVQKLGCKDTHFVNPHGLHDDEHYTTVYDMYLIMNELIKYDVFLEIGALESFTAKFEDASGNRIKKVYENTDKFLTGAKELSKKTTIIGSKTGTTFKAGCCLAIATENKKGRRISIIMKARISDVLYNEMNSILEMK